MSDDDVLAAFAKLPLPVQMREAVAVQQRASKRNGSNQIQSFWSARSLLSVADLWEAEDAKKADRERIVEEFGRILASEVGTWPDDEWHLRTKPNYYTDKARLLLDRFPHIAEGWPK